MERNEENGRQADGKDGDRHESLFTCIISLSTGE